MEHTAKSFKKGEKAKRNRFVDVLIGVLLVGICLVLAKSLLNQISLKHEVKDATTASDQIITAIRQKDGKKARDLSYKTFKSDNSATNLTAQFNSISKYTTAAPTVDRTVVTNDNAGQAVSVIYRFPSKPVVYVRVFVIKPEASKTFQMAKLFVDTNEKKLLDGAQ